ncbi:MAG: hypothetical protein IK132_06240 [Clostridia bacterium]|nr:hypothetical protein [Clostridia bacterium]
MKFFDRTDDVTVSEGILKFLKLDDLLSIRNGNILDYLTTDIGILERRRRVVSDTSRIPGCAEIVEYLVKQLTYISEITKKKSVSDVEERSLYSIRQTELYMEIVDRTAEFWKARREEFQSDDYRALFAHILDICESSEYNNLKKGTARLIEDVTNVKSISLGFNFDASLAPYEAGVISVNPYYIESGTLIDRLLRLDFDNKNVSMAPLVSAKKNARMEDFDAMEQSIYRALGQVFKRAIRQWEPEVSAYIADKLSFLIEALPSFEFILKINQITDRMKQAGLKLAEPVYCSMPERVLEADGLYNPVLAINLAEKGAGSCVTNDFRFDEQGTVYILTGPNNGGKSVFMSSVCIAQILAQLGMEVPAKRLRISPVEGIFVHMPSYEGLNAKGRLMDECDKIKQIFEKMPEYSLAVFDETYSSTDPDDAIELSAHLVRALSARRVRSIFGTHYHALKARLSEEATEGVDYLTAGLDSDGRRTYQITRSTEDNASDGFMIAEKMGVTFENLAKRNVGIE